MLKATFDDYAGINSDAISSISVGSTPLTFVPTTAFDLLQPGATGTPISYTRFKNRFRVWPIPTADMPLTVIRSVV